MSRPNTYLLDRAAETPPIIRDLRAHEEQWVHPDRCLNRAFRLMRNRVEKRGWTPGRAFTEACKRLHSIGDTKRSCGPLEQLQG